MLIVYKIFMCKLQNMNVNRLHVCSTLLVYNQNNMHLFTLIYACVIYKIFTCKLQNMNVNRLHHALEAVIVALFYQVMIHAV
jgi:hypothetical protein